MPTCSRSSVTTSCRLAARCQRSETTFAAIPSSHATNGNPRHSNRGRAGQRLVEDIRRRILRLFTVVHAMCDVGVDPFKIVLIQLGEARRILPRRLHLEALIV